MELVALLMALANVLLALIIAFYQVRMLMACRKNPPTWCWLRAIYVALALYWAGVYGFILITEDVYSNWSWFTQVFIRPALTFTLALMAASSIWRGRARQ